MLTIRNSYFDNKLLRSHCNYIGKENHFKKMSFEKISDCIENRV